MKSLQVILVVFGVLIAVALAFQYFQRQQKINIEGFNNNECPKVPCPSGCNPPTKLSDNCSQIYTEDDGRCYKLCPFECTDPMSECVTNDCCENCGKVKLYVDCKTGDKLHTEPDLNDPNQETNYSSSTINTCTTNKSRNDIQGSVLEDDARDRDVVANTSQTSVQTSLQRSKAETRTQKEKEPTVIEYHNHYYGIIDNKSSDLGKRISYTCIPQLDVVVQQRGTSNPYRQGGDIDDKLDEQTKVMNYGLSKKQDASSVMNYGAYGTPKSSNAATTYKEAQSASQNLTATGMYMENTTPGFNSLYSLNF